MGNEAINLGRGKTIVVIGHTREIVRERCVETSAECLREYFCCVSSPCFFVEACSTLYNVANCLEPYGSNITLDHP